MADLYSGLHIMVHSKALFVFSLHSTVLVSSPFRLRSSQPMLVKKRLMIVDSKKKTPDKNSYETV